jgi:hypothetical protein
MGQVNSGQAQDEGRNPRLTSERKIAVRWVFIIETWYQDAFIRLRST